MDSQNAKRKRRRRRKSGSKSSEGALSRNESSEKDTPVSPRAKAQPTGEQEPRPTGDDSVNNSKKRKASSSNKRSHKRPIQDDSMKRQPPAASAKAPTCDPQHPFEVDATDHCETPLEAYHDVTALLDQIAGSTGKTRASLSIYDPYYCDGGVKSKLNSLGFKNVRNDNEDFYENIKNGKVPDFDVLVTNPPYSGIHVEKLLTFVAKAAKPFLLLLPHYVYTKDYYQRAFGSKVNPFFLVPKSRYSYLPPSWVQNGSTALAKGKVTTSPFPSFWYCRSNKVSSKWLTQTYGASGVYRHDRKLQYASCPAHIPRDMKGEFDATKKRANPRARKRAAAKKRAALAGEL